MGLPGFFSWLLKQYKDHKDLDMINIKLSVQPSRLYIDANCAFHPQCFKVLGYYNEEKINNETLEDKMIERIINYIDFLVKYVDPQELVYISVDGVAPLAKIKQQRMRRFRSVEENKIRTDLKKKHKLSINNSWSNTVITPGTEFMEKLHQRLSNHFKTNKSKLKYVYSSYHTPGEGEHKILQHIKKTALNEKDTYVIYGLDADLFFLAMASNRNNLYLLREASQFDNKEDHKITDPIKDVAEPLKYVSVDKTKSMYYEHLLNIINYKVDETGKAFNPKDFNKKNFCDDFIVICYLLGNDFLPHLPSIDIKVNGLDIILDSYSDVYLDNGKHLTHRTGQTVEIDNIMFLELIGNLGTKEFDYFTYLLPNHKERINKRRCQESDPYKIELWELENMKNIKIEDNIKFGIGSEERWKFNYYYHYFHTVEEMTDNIGNICYSYLEGIRWVTDYYFNECIDWTWQYPYFHGPFLSDIGQYYYETKLDINKIKFKKSEPFNPCAQLLAVLPPQCQEILPKTYRTLVSDSKSPILDLYPMKVEIDMINKDQLWQCIPIVPIVDNLRIRQALDNEKYKLTKKEEERNKVFNDIVY